MAQAKEEAEMNGSPQKLTLYNSRKSQAEF